MKRGDIVLVHGDSVSDKLIQRTTFGPFNHVGLAIDGTQMVNALAQGIVLSTVSIGAYLHKDKTVIPAPSLALRPNVQVVDPRVPIATWHDAMRYETALLWAEHCAGQEYGWWDIFNHSVKWLLSATPLRVPEIVEKNAWDCSNFISRFLVEAGYPLPPFYLDFNDVTPNDIGRLFGVIDKKGNYLQKRGA